MNKSNPNFSAYADQINAGINSHRRTISALTTAAFAIGFLTIIASIVVVFCYVVFYQPKQNELLKQVLAAALAQQPTAGSEQKPDHGAAAEVNIRSAQAALTGALSYGVVFLSIAIGCLALGTIIMLALIMLQRRATLAHISTSLAQISAQLKQLCPPA